MPKKPTRLAAAQATAIATAPSAEAIEKTSVSPLKRGATRIMYIECKAGALTGNAHIGHVTFSKTWKTIYYQGQVFRRLPQGGFKSNYYDRETRDDYWISGPKKDGSDRLYNERVPVEIDEDAREEYWSSIRNQPERKHEKVA